MLAASFLHLIAGPPSSTALTTGSGTHELASIFGKTMSKQGMIKLQALRNALEEKVFILLPEVLQIFEQAVSLVTAPRAQSSYSLS